MKFGGALMNNASNINKVAGIINEYNCEPLVVVVSAFDKTTNHLEKLAELSKDDSSLPDEFFKVKKYHLRAAQQIMPTFPPGLDAELDNIFYDLWEALTIGYSNRYKRYDAIVTFGEELSSCIMYYYLKQQGLIINLVSSKNLIVTNSNFTDASVNWQYTSKTITSRVIPILQNKQIVLTQGFTGADEGGNSTTLGREGSDFTAAIFANVLNADEVTIWKNVPGLMNADPKRFADAKKIDAISYHEAIELAYYGASVIHPKTIQPLKQKNIPLFVRPYYDTSLSPTVITDDVSNDLANSSIIVKDNQILLSISTMNLSFIGEGNLMQIFGIFSKNKIHINLMQNSAVSFSVCFNEDLIKLNALTEELKGTFVLRYNTGLQLVTIRNYNDKLLEEIIGSRKVYLFQKSRTNVQFLIK